MEKYSETQSSIQFVFQPNFSAALEREQNSIEEPAIVSDTNMTIEDSFGSWREWD